MPMMVICFHKSVTLAVARRYSRPKNNQIYLFFCSLIRNFADEKNEMIMMKTQKEYIRILQSHADELQSRFGITAMRLFGSVARGEHHDGSDVDIFVAMPPKFYNHVAAAQYLEELLGCNVDLIQDHARIRPFFRKQIEEYGINIIPATADSERLAPANS